MKTTRLILLLFLFTSKVLCQNEDVNITQYKIPLRSELALAIKNVQRDSKYSLYEILMACGYGVEKGGLNITSPENDTYNLEFCSSNISAQALIMWITNVSYFDPEEKTIRMKIVTVEDLQKLIMREIEASDFEIEREREIQKRIQILRASTHGGKTQGDGQDTPKQ